MAAVADYMGEQVFDSLLWIVSIGVNIHLFFLVKFNLGKLFGLVCPEDGVSLPL